MPEQMTMRQAAEIALDALNIYREHNEENIGLADAAYEALRQALAQPDEVLAEREACAKLCDEWNTAITDKLAAAIRAMGEK